MSKHIPLGVQEEILKRLPVKPLIQFRSVSKPWKSLIDSPQFIAAYGVRQTRPNLLILRYENFVGQKRYLTLVDDDDTVTIQDFARTVPDLIKNIESNSSVVGSSHGLFSFKYNIKEIVVVWNLSIGKSIRIEVPYMHDSPDFVKDSRVYNFIGFGVCPVTFDPTIIWVRCIDYERKKDDMPGVPWKAGVFTLSTGTWSILSTDLPRESIALRRPQVVIDRVIYWLAFDMLDAEDVPLIMSFDLTAKEFKEINLPDSLTNRCCRIRTISKLQESLVLLAYHGEFEEDLSVCSLWMMMMNEQGVDRSFTKLYNINVPNATVKTLLGFLKTGELIMKPQQQWKSNFEVEMYNPDSEAIVNLRIVGAGYHFFMCSYVETLLLLDQLDGFIYSFSN